MKYRTVLILGKAFCIFILLHFPDSKLSVLNFSPPQRPLGVVVRLGRKKKKAHGGRWEGEREKRLPPFPSSHRPPRAFYLAIIAILIGIPRGNLWGVERY